MPYLGGALTVSGRNGSVRLPADYVASHVELAYAQTSHATQGRTVDRSFPSSTVPPTPAASTFR